MSETTPEQAAAWGSPAPASAPAPADTPAPASTPAPIFGQATSPQPPSAPPAPAPEPEPAAPAASDPSSSTSEAPKVGDVLKWTETGLRGEEKLCQGVVLDIVEHSFDAVPTGTEAPRELVAIVGVFHTTAVVRGNQVV